MDDQSYKRVRALVDLFLQEGLSELSVEDSAFKLRLSRATPKRNPTAVARRRPAAPRRSGRGRTVAVRAPLIGVFYRAPAPDAPAFVEVGDIVAEGQTVCIVEAMKVFNEIKADWPGRVAAIPSENGQLVQAGDPLVVLEFLDERQQAQEG
jgi:biotin carboxyl carrier protein